MVTALATKSNTSLVLGDYGEIEEFAKRIKMLMRGGDKLSNPEVMALAQFAKLTNLNPFIGECWYIPGSGPMVGIAGARRLGQEQAGDAGGFSFPTITPVSPEEAGALESELKDVAAAFKAEITDTSAVFAYQKMFTATIQAMREAGVADPFAAAKEVCGPRPSWVGYGYSTRGERSRMNKTQLARKRAEADALKKIIVIPFGAQVADSDVSPEYVDAPAEDVTPKRTKEQNLTELGFAADVKAVDQAFPPEPQMTYEEAQKVFDIKPSPVTQDNQEPVLQMYKYNDDRIIQPVRKILTFTAKEAAQTLYEAYQKKQIALNLTVTEAEEFARNLIAPK
jgi:hypothetical protein